MSSCDDKGERKKKKIKLSANTMKRFNQNRAWMFPHHFNELKELDDSWVEKVVSGAVVQQGINDRLKQVPFDNVAVIVLVF